MLQLAYDILGVLAGLAVIAAILGALVLGWLQRHADYLAWHAEEKARRRRIKERRERGA